ncbi:Dph6-related ATP pyrophosphatase [Daejeonella oryzae]|uniref:Dph6-related ATP pyrophosphatase n=1 Tax=Daejeonella oryzae TaxID=1122943 RepID=UPI000410487E|nr:diphthine--ammonia ligase [Daejeonella oryzae]
MKKAVLFWSGGKDSAMALYYARQNKDIEVVALICTINEEFKRVSMHGIRESVIERQVAQTGLPLIKMWVPNQPDNLSYEKVLTSTYQNLKEEGIEIIIYGDIFLEDIRWYRNHLLNKNGLKGYFPLWERNTAELMEEFIKLEFKAILCCIHTGFLDESTIGAQLDQQFLNDLPVIVDPCGENGEFHTFCYAGPVFSQEISFETGERDYAPLNVKSANEQFEAGFWYIDIY